ncbi:hypothetical protein [Streptomyces sp. NPDC088766]|uniref:hypothetical protein n=1 Tax=Streptomyces sp. NPDC088766 TaxID=3365893 RepID=UPI003804B499
MRTFFMVATAFPTFLFTVPLLVAAGSWLLVAVGAADPRAFDENADLGAPGPGGVPVAVPVSLWTALARSAGLGAAVVLEPLASPGPARALTGLAVLAAAAALSWCATRAPARLPQRLRPDEPGPSTPDFAGPRRTVRPERADDGPFRSDRPDAAHRARGRAA